MELIFCSSRTCVPYQRGFFRFVQKDSWIILDSDSWLLFLLSFVYLYANMWQWAGPGQRYHGGCRRRQEAGNHFRSVPVLVNMLADYLPIYGSHRWQPSGTKWCKSGTGKWTTRSPRCRRMLCIRRSAQRAEHRAGLPALSVAPKYSATCFGFR